MKFHTVYAVKHLGSTDCLDLVTGNQGTFCCVRPPLPSGVYVLTKAVIVLVHELRARKFLQFKTKTNEVTSATATELS